MPEAMETATRKWVIRLAGGLPGASEGYSEEMPPASSHETCIYGSNGARVHVKFFGRTRGRTSVTYDPCKEMEAEYGILKEFEKNGFSSGRYRIVRALGYNEKLDCALATAYVGGDTLLSIIHATLKGRDGEARMLGALDLTAGLLRRIHTVMPQGPGIDADEAFHSFLKPLLYLEEQDALDGFHRRITKALGRWHRFKPLFEQRGVTVHGDANPSNFKVDEGVVYGFDVEHSRPGRSPLLDVGTMVAELRHHCAHIAGDARKAEPYAEHFLHAYAPAARDRDRMGPLLPFYVSRGLFKIAMLGYWRYDYRRRLVEEGTRCLEAGP